MRKVKVCKRCSGFDIKELKAHAKEANCKFKIGCVKKCHQKHPELTDKYFGLIDGNFASFNTEEEFMDKMK